VPLELLLDTECEDFSQVLETNVIGPFRLTKVVAGSMALRGAGTVVHLSSDAAVEAYERWGAYGVSKAAFDHLARSFAAELLPHGVRFVAVDPGEMNVCREPVANIAAGQRCYPPGDTCGAGTGCFFDSGPLAYFCRSYAQIGAGCNVFSNGCDPAAAACTNAVCVANPPAPTCP
jgi:hypothetical protein